MTVCTVRTACKHRFICLLTTWHCCVQGAESPMKYCISFQIPRPSEWPWELSNFGQSVSFISQLSCHSVYSLIWHALCILKRWWVASLVCCGRPKAELLTGVPYGSTNPTNCPQLVAAKVEFKGPIYKKILGVQLKKILGWVSDLLKILGKT